jgi:hypothetical protein
MLWELGAGGAIGLLLGLRFRLPALLAASGAMAAACLTVAFCSASKPLIAVGMTFAALGVLQLGYVAGLLLSCAWSKVRHWPAGRLTLASDNPPRHG